MIFNRFLFFCVAFSFLAACAPEKREHTESKKVEAYRLIDEQRTDEAVELLEDSLRKDPENAEYKVVLASAYAHKSGFRIQALIPAVAKAKSFKQEDTQLVKTITKAKEGGRAAAIMQLARVFNQFSEFLKIYHILPELQNETQKIYLQHAVDLLSSLGKDLKPEDALYKAVLEVLLLKHELSDQLVGEFSAEADYDKCALNLSGINATLIRLAKLLIDIYYDIGVAMPDQAPKMKALAASASDAVSGFSIAITSVTALDEAVNVFLKQNAVQNGFGKIIKCNVSQF